MTQSGDGLDGYTPRAYEAEVYAKVAGANAGKNPLWSSDWRDPADVAGKYSTKSAEFYERKLAAEGGGYRDGLDTSDVDYRAFPHQQLISMVSDGASPEDVDEQGMIVNDFGNAFKELSTTVRQAAAKEQAGWQGEGAQAAFGYLAQYANWADDSGDKAFLSANRYSQTSAALSAARNSMPEPAGRTVTQSMDLAHQQLASGDIGGLLDTYENMESQARVAFETQQRAAQVVAQRDQMLYSGGSTQPNYVPPPQLSSVATPPPTTGSSVGGSNAVIPDLGRTTAASAGGPSATVAGGAPIPSGGGSLPPAGLPPTGLPGGGTSGSGPGGYPPPVSGGGDASGWNRTSGPTLNPGLAAGLPIAGGSGCGGDIERGGSGRSGGGSSGRTGRRVPVGGTEQEPAGGKRSGTAEPGAKAAAQAAREGLAGKTGKPGASGIPGAAAGGKKGEEDKEHKRPGYLVEADPYDALGVKIQTDEHGNKIAPPVLGE